MAMYFSYTSQLSVLVTYIILAISLHPKDNMYGEFPLSGRITIMQSKGNTQQKDVSGRNIGIETFESKLDFGTEWFNSAALAFISRSPLNHGWNEEFHNYQLEWTPCKLCCQ